MCRVCMGMLCVRARPPRRVCLAHPRWASGSACPRTYDARMHTRRTPHRTHARARAHTTRQVEDEELSVEEAKERRIMKLLLKVKNGSPPQRKSGLRQLTDKARDFGAGPLFNQILPLLMSPTLEDQERHLLVKVRGAAGAACVSVGRASGQASRVAAGAAIPAKRA